MARPLKEINWDMVEKLIEAGCNGYEIADTFRIDTDTFYIRFKKEYGRSFQDYSANIYSAGIGYQKYVTHLRALSKTGSVQLLIRYNEERLGWAKTSDIKPPNDDDIDKDHTIMLQADEIVELKSNANKPETE